MGCLRTGRARFLVARFTSEKKENLKIRDKQITGMEHLRINGRIARRRKVHKKRGVLGEGLRRFGKYKKRCPRIGSERSFGSNLSFEKRWEPSH